MAEVTDDYTFGEIKEFYRDDNYSELVFSKALKKERKKEMCAFMRV